MFLNEDKKAFTLIELLIVIGIIAILAAAVIIAINPGQQFAAARDAVRESHINSLKQSFLGYRIDNHGSFSELDIPVQFQEVCNTNEIPEGEDPDVWCGDLINLSELHPK